MFYLRHTENPKGNYVKLTEEKLLSDGLSASIRQIINAIKSKSSQNNICLIVFV